MFNLSKQLSQETLDTLNLGLSFVPTPIYNPFRTCIDLYKLFRNIKLKKFFGQSASLPVSTFKCKSTFFPTFQDPSIIVFEKLVLRDLMQYERVHVKPHRNLTSRQYDLLREVSEDSSITIKAADKGGGIVILDTTVYRDEALRQLNDTSSNLKIQSDPTRSILNMVKTIIYEALTLDYVTKDLADFLLVEHPRVPRFYLLPKIHKPGFSLRGRPIVAAQDSVLINISKYVDHLLQPHVKRISIYLHDTRDFILKIERYHPTRY